MNNSLSNHWLVSASKIYIFIALLSTTLLSRADELIISSAQPPQDAPIRYNWDVSGYNIDLANFSLGPTIRIAPTGRENRPLLGLIEETRSIIEFDLSNVISSHPDGFNDRIKLKLNVWSLIADGGSSLMVYGAPGDGTINNNDFNLAGQLLGSFTASVGIVNLDITDFINNLIKSSARWAWIGLRVDPSKLPARQNLTTDTTFGASIYSANSGLAPALVTSTAIADLEPYPFPTNTNTNSRQGGIGFNWTTPNNAVEYDLRYNTQLITDNNWDVSTKLENYGNNPFQPEPGEIGNHFFCCVPIDGTKLYFAIKYRDQIPNNWTGLSNIASILESGFKVKHDGFSFKNGKASSLFPNSVENALSAENLAFLGGQKACKSGGTPQTCVLTTKAENFRNRMKKDMEYGLCLGLNVTALRFFKGFDSPQEFGVNTVFEMGHENMDPMLYDKLGENIIFYHMQQFFSLDYLRKTYGKIIGAGAFSIPYKTPISKVFLNIAQSLTKPIPSNPVVLVCGNRYEDCHSLLPFAITDKGDEDWYKIHVYDSNYPGGIVPVNINPKEGLWNFNELNQSLDEPNKYHVKDVMLSNFVSKPEDPELGDQIVEDPNEQIPDTNTTIRISGQGNLLITDVSGKKLGIDGDVFVSEISNAYATAIASSSIKEGNLQKWYYLTPTGTTTVKIFANPDALAQISDFFLIGEGGTDLYIDNIALSPSTNDEVIFSADKNTFSYKVAETQTPSFSLVTDDEYEFVVSGLPLDGANILTLSNLSDAGKLAIRYAGNGAKHYDFKMTKNTDTSKDVFVQPSISISAGDTQYLSYRSWNNGIVRLEIDQRSDGTIDEVISLGKPTNQPPVANAGPDQTVESTGPSGASVTLDGSGSSDPDPDNDPLTFAWTGPFGTASGPNPTVALPLGTHTITLTVVDGHGGTATDTVVVQVRDTTPPVLSLPTDISTAATDSSGAVVTYTASAKDLVDGAVSPNCTPTSGSTFPIGTTTVACTATDKAENTTSGSFKVAVVGTTPPSTSAFSAFSVNPLRINQRLKTLFLLSSFTLGSGSNGIDPTKEPVTLTMAGFTATIPAGSFRKGSGPFGVYAFAGKIDGVPIEMLITPLRNNRFGFQAAAYGVNPSVADNSVTVGLAIGNDSGTTSVKPVIIK